jgi:protein gp37
VRKFKPVKDGLGVRPHRVFVNSMSDLMHEDVTDTFRDKVFDAMEDHEFTVFQVLTKRPMTLRRYIERRYAGQGLIPANIWLGVSCEDNRVRGRLDTLRRMKDALGAFTAFVSVEPLIGNPDKHDYSVLDWILIGGESRQGKELQRMDADWAKVARDKARHAGAAVWFKQWGDWSNNPLYYRHAPDETLPKLHVDRVRRAMAAGEREADIEEKNGKLRVTGEKGGATLDGQVIHEHPPAYERLRVLLNQRRALALLD